MFRCCWLLLGAVRYFFFLFNSLLLSVCCFAFLFNVGLFVNTATQLYQPVVATSYCKMPKNKRAREDTNTHTHEHARTHRHTIIIHKHGGTTTTSSIATHRVFVHSVDSVFYFIIFLVQMVVVHVFASSTENWKYLRILIFFFCSVICFVNKIISCVDRKSIAIP